MRSPRSKRSRVTPRQARQSEGTQLIELNRTEIFTHLRFWPQIKIAAGAEEQSVVENRTRCALQSAQKHNLVANSVKSQIIVEPTINIVA